MGQLREDYPDVPIIALTATANQRTREDIVNQLRLRDHALFTQSFNRPNLKYVVKDKKNVLADIVNFINGEHPNQSGVIYCLSRKSCQQVAEQLREKGLAAKFFHAGLSKEEKNRLLEDWKMDKFHIVVATVRDHFVRCLSHSYTNRSRLGWVSIKRTVKALDLFFECLILTALSVRFVIHYDLPKSLSGYVVQVTASSPNLTFCSYYQETGRAGRDGKPADCILCA